MNECTNKKYHKKTTVSMLLFISCLQPGYTGTQCQECADGYYGNPLVPGGRCQKCSCSMNIDPRASENCDRVTGQCLRCLHNTAGFSCERCASGYFGDALTRNCTGACGSNCIHGLVLPFFHSSFFLFYLTTYSLSY